MCALSITGKLFRYSVPSQKLPKSELQNEKPGYIQLPSHTATNKPILKDDVVILNFHNIFLNFYHNIASKLFLPLIVPNIPFLILWVYFKDTA